MPEPTTSPALEVRHHADRTVLRFTNCDALDEYNGLAVSQELGRLLDSLTGDHLVLDLDGIRYVTSMTLGTFIALNRRVRQAGGTFALTNVDPLVQEVLTITRLDQLLTVTPA